MVGFIGYQPSSRVSSRAAEVALGAIAPRSTASSSSPLLNIQGVSHLITNDSHPYFEWSIGETAQNDIGPANSGSDAHHVVNLNQVGMPVVPSDAALVPIAFFATTVNVYVVPDVRPAIEHVSAVPDTVHVPATTPVLVDAVTV